MSPRRHIMTLNHKVGDIVRIVANNSKHGFEIGARR